MRRLARILMIQTLVMTICLMVGWFSGKIPAQVLAWALSAGAVSIKCKLQIRCASNSTSRPRLQCKFLRQRRWVISVPCECSATLKLNDNLS